MAKINPAATVIPDKAEVWIALKSDVTDINGVIPASMIPSAPTDDLEALGWEFSGLIDDKKGIPVNPAIEVKPYDAFGHPRFRVKLKKGTLETGFTVLETNSVTRKFVLPGSSAKRIGIPKDVQIFVLYRFVDEDIARVWVSLTPAPVEVKSHGGVVDGELSFAECVVHHTATADGDVFELLDNAEVTKVFTIDSGVTAYTVTVDGETTTSISTMTATALQAALRALPNVGSDGVTVTGSSGGPLTAVFSVVVTTVSAAGTGGDVAVS
ncbi:major tail protein [Mycobacterium phage IdentityCrisis]|uniref:Major tail protein n=1 Tax=Mycobacterium phage IdentityCrisis TaxID=2599866 RepID=A0A5J6TMU1_9CAUD|nr:major tail protein [Mycobacterium phage IdentityCrisis]QFG10032.1 major tail protein [Mycobacterium phage IdentityCrisis]